MRIVVRGFSIDALSSVRVELAELCAILMRGARGLRAKGYELFFACLGSFLVFENCTTMARWASVDYRRTFLVVLLLVAYSSSVWLSTPCFVRAFSSAPRVQHPAIFSRPAHPHLLSATIDDHDDKKSTLSAAKLAPLWTSLAATAGLLRPDAIGPTLGSLPTVSASLSVLMLAMGLTTSPKDVRDSFSQQRGVLLLNAICCFVMMPLLAVAITRNFLNCSPQVAAGTIILGSVGGGQASNLFALLAGGSVSLSVVCTLSTTILGVVATPYVVGLLLGKSIPMNGMAILISTARLVLAPLCAGIALSGLFPGMSRKLPTAKLGIVAMMILCAGGAANSADSLLASTMWKPAVACSVLLPIIGGAVALVLANLFKIDETSKRTLVVEVLSKSPTVAYVIALKHFDKATAVVPSAGMVSLAVLGALVASIWSRHEQ